MLSHKYLVKVIYIQEKSEIICYFRDNNSQKAVRFPFKPYFILNNDFDLLKLKELINFFGIKNFNIVSKNNFIKVFSNSINSLKEISKILGITTGKKYLILDPTRVFLLEKDWSFFDIFYFENDIPIKAFSKNNFFEILSPLISFEDALKIDEKNVNALIENSVFSNLLKIPINNIPTSFNEKLELFLENIYFSNAGVIQWDDVEKIYSKKDFAPYGLFENFSEIDFSMFWVQIMTKSFFNLGQDTINCGCCKPIRINDSNIIPASSIEVIPIENELFYISSSKKFSNYFHNNNVGKKARVLRKNEFFLKNFPVGPLFSNNKYLVPFDDAVKLLDEKKVSLSKNHSLFWFCKNKESFFSKDFQNVFLKVFSLEKYLAEYSNNLLFEKSFDYFFVSKKLFLLKKLLSSIPNQLLSRFSKFFSNDLANSIISIQESILFKFETFSEKNGFRIIYSTNNNVFVKGSKSLSLTKDFSSTLKLPQPVVSNFSKNHCFR
jgi:hypothetical protein